MRLFLAIDLGAELRHAVYESTAPLREAAPALAWVREEQLHLTLKFYGDVDEGRVSAIVDAMRGVAARHRVIELAVGEAGAFPGFRRARVVWLGVEREPRLELLHHDVEVASEALGFEVDGRAFRPHLTLARVRGRADEAALRALQRAARGVNFRGTLVVRSLDLMRSDLTSAGSRYILLDAAPLRST